MTTTSDTIPSLSITSATPPRDPCAVPSSSNSLQKNQTPRLLYRGALSLPDSNLTLDGLTFTISLPADDPQASLRLLENPLPLALETMRGRPTLHFVGVEKLDNLYCDFSGGVNLHVHPRCVLTHQLFSNHLCETPITSPKGHTDYGIRIRFGDPDATCPGPSNPPTKSATTTNDMIVYGRAHPSSSILQLCVGRVLPAPPPVSIIPKAVSKLRPPRPDDPTPRKPPAGFAGIARIGLGAKRPLAASASEGSITEISIANSKGKGREEFIDGGAKKKARRSGDGQDATACKKLFNETLKDLGKNSRAGSKLEATFKIPPLPPIKGEKPSTKGKPSSVTEPDVFDLTFEPENSSSMSEMETRNKSYMKKVVVRLMSAAGIGKQHAEFKEFFNHVYRGTAFALRSKMRSIDFEADSREVELLDRIAQAHVTMYLGGKGLGVYLLQ